MGNYDRLKKNLCRGQKNELFFKGNQVDLLRIVNGTGSTICLSICLNYFLSN